MRGSSHIRGFRLFEFAQAQAAHERSQLTDWENEHLRLCRECQDISLLFVQQLKKRQSHLSSNGEINPSDGYYKNLCCGLELYIAAGKAFPDCQRHQKLPTVWKLISQDFAAFKLTDKNKDKDSAA
jgi:hypothetical protein